MNLIADKKGTDKIISVYWFVILFIVAGAVVYMASVFYGTSYDVRRVEANAMVNQIADCITDGNRLNTSVNNGNFMEDCHFDFGKESKDYFVEIPLLKIEQGNVNLREYCDKKGEKLPRCLKRELYVLGTAGSVEIKVVINKINENG